jgi:hypothetical protein
MVNALDDSRLSTVLDVKVRWCNWGSAQTILWVYISMTS